jgi:hypothetical protein
VCTQKSHNTWIRIDSEPRPLYSIADCPHLNPLSDDCSLYSGATMSKSRNGVVGKKLDEQEPALKKRKVVADVTIVVGDVEF